MRPDICSPARASRPDLTPGGVRLTIWWFSGEWYSSGLPSGLLVRVLGSVLGGTDNVSGRPTDPRRSRPDLAVSQPRPDVFEDSNRASGLAPIGSIRRPEAGTSASTRCILAGPGVVVNGLGRNPQKKRGKPPDIPRGIGLVHKVAHRGAFRTRIRPPKGGRNSELRALLRTRRN